MKKFAKVICLSLTYNANGHSKDYLDSFVEQLKKDIDVSVLCYGDPRNKRFPITFCNGEISDLNYKSEEFMSSQRKIIRRFFASCKLYFHSLKCDDVKTSKLYFLDYEYLSLAIFLILFFRKQKKYILIHSFDTSGSILKKIYKKLFFKIVSMVGQVTFIVNGEEALARMKAYGFNDVKLVQYPTELKIRPLSDKKAKSILDLNGKKVFSLIGMIRADKNYSEAIKAFSKSSLCNSDSHHLLVAGYPSNVTENDVLSYFKLNGVKNYTFIPKYLTDEELNTVFSASDYLLVPYGNGGTSQSGPLSQARLYNLPAITQASGEIGNYIQREKVGRTFDTFDDLVDILNSSAEVSCSYDFSLINNKYSWAQARAHYIDIFSEYDC